MKKSIKTLLFTYGCLAVCFLYAMTASAQADTLAINGAISQGLPVIGSIASSISPMWGQIITLCIPVIFLIIRNIEKSKMKANVADLVQPIIDNHTSGTPQKTSDVNALKTLTK
jgi:hypothetical protein